VNRSIEIKRLGGGDVSREQFFLVRQYQLAGDPRKALQLLPQMVKEYDRPAERQAL
jgi:hypothetical protein